MSIIIALTGGMGTGKSTAAQLLAELLEEWGERSRRERACPVLSRSDKSAPYLIRGHGVQTCDFDQLAREVIDGSADLRQALAAAFGAQVLHADGSLNRPALAQAAFASTETTQQLNALTHPAIIQAARTLIAAAQAAGDSLIMQSPLPIATLSPNQPVGDAYHASRIPQATTSSLHIWSITAPLDLRLARLQTRGFTHDDALLRIQRQPADEVYQREATATLANNTTPDALRSQIQAQLAKEF